ncbi:aminopeptidase [Actinomadura sp. NPDC047616]|uniref:aminopeptidase n=1 Tax=Actinomadura sp. NPDC047616 TaxID=3155914 RepID=UPI0033CAED72
MEASVSDSARLVVEELLQVHADERVGIVLDAESVRVMVEAIAEAVASLGAECTLMEMPVRMDAQRNELTRPIERALEETQVLIGLTGSCGAPTYSAVVQDLLKREQLRMISMVMRPLEVFTGGGALADYRALHDDGRRLGRLWESGRRMRITSPAGTDITAPIAFEDVWVECGYANRPGMASAFSDGEVSSRPLEGTAEGVIVVDGPIAHLGKPDEPLRIDVAGGRVQAVAGASGQAAELRHLLDTISNLDNIAEFGIGLNPACRRNGRFEEEKKARGNVHIALGDNIFYGGTTASPIHMDMVIYEPTVTLDDKVLVERGHVRL